jgi:hypothetical protein
VRFGGLRTVAFDGCNSVKIPDTGRNRTWLGRIRCRMSWAGYPTLRLMALAETGTRALLGATVGSVTDRDETALATRLLHLFPPGMLVLLDRGFDAGWFFAEVASTGAMLLARACSSCNPQVREHLPDGSYLSCLDGREVRIIEADLVVTGADGSRIGDRYRLITTLTDHRRFPILQAVLMSLRGTPCGRENGVGLPADAGISLECEPVKAVWRRGPTWKGHALLLRARRSEFRFPTEAPGHPRFCP